MKIFLMLLAALILAVPAPGRAASFSDLGNTGLINRPEDWGAVNTHDPSLVRGDDGRWYVFSTDASAGDIHRCGVQVRVSDDLTHWEYLGAAFDDYETTCAEEIAAARLNPSKHDGLWAPDVVKVGDQWRMYYSASTFGSSRSVIGMAVSGSLTGPWEDKGIVIRSDAGASAKPNAIDPCIFTDPSGKQYMTWGSFFGGIWLTALDENGFAEGEPVRIAGFRGCRAEGSYLIWLPQTEYYYLFVSYGSLLEDYNIRVGRSRTIEGPYLDANGRQMTDLVAANESRIGVKLMGGYQLQHDNGTSLGIKAPGHCSVAVDGERLWLCHHTRTQKLADWWFAMQIRPMMLSADGWPLVMPMSYQGETFEPVTELPEGAYNLIRHETDSNKAPKVSERITLKDGRLDDRGSCALEDGRVNLTLDGVCYDGVALWQTDDERGGRVMSISAISGEGECIWLGEETIHEEETSR
ncbi:arabinan endo-1,5-alpha-L-arabinosidase [Aristaeella hokkaidonensis]|uniref:Arabinan endo-1,5-alpha-L-arabinosidase n=1 Tax=Aristaeella hokkaidonensis TaxID=3046382 RepID=A0AC61N7E3_9FIRM|nr:arabinan endo-1,5-alpha-L-arabinosidase [Aristaeella hokkaidonensis]QUC67399.1 arabinan endo-1,5-alpha-L-arabinosidase [Aristaeella hokkaidonensis]SNT93261.1 arabinan endo-1,5-alpha-L-arabinosidase [Aristaeella hokkaidonensis]